jgi:hypothetical protein
VTVPDDRGSVGPWYLTHRRAASAVAVVLFAAVAALRFAIRGSQDPVTELAALPIALLAITFGRRIGTAAGLASVALIAVWVATTDVSLTPLGWASRVVPLVLLGVLLGASTDRLREAQAGERRLAAVAALQREAAEVNDSVVQGLAVAKWLLEADQLDRGLAAVTETMSTAQDLVSRMLGAGSPLPGDLRRAEQIRSGR